MRKFLLLLIVSALSVASQAKTWSIKLDIEDADHVSVYLTDENDNVTETLAIKNGENTWEREIDTTMRLVITADENYVLRYSEDGERWSTESDNKIEETLSTSSWSSGVIDLKIKVIPLATYRDRSVRVTVDRPESVLLRLKGLGSFTPAETDFDLAYSSENEYTLEVQTKEYGSTIYRVEADGAEVKMEYGSYTIKLVDNSDADAPAYVQNIDIKVDYPADLQYTVTIGFANNNSECVSSVTYDGKEVEGFDAPEGFKVTPGKKLNITVDTDLYDFVSYLRNGELQTTYGSTITETILSDISYVITANKYETFTATLVVDNPEAITVSTGSYWSPTYIQLSEGENQVEAVADKSDEYCIRANDGYELTKVYDETLGKDYLAQYFDGYILLSPDSRVIIETAKIVYDDNAVVYIDNATDVTASLSCGKSNMTLSEGYNNFPFREKDGAINVSASGATQVKAYRNGEEITVNYPRSFPLNPAANGDVFKIFFNPENAVTHTVTFNDPKGLLTTCDITMDIATKVNPSAPVSAVGKTRFTIAQALQANDELKLVVNGAAIVPLDGVYTFETESDTTVTVDSTSSVDEILSDGDNVADVYTLQGVLIIRNADAAQIKSLPAGIYVIGNRTIAIK